MQALTSLPLAMPTGADVTDAELARLLGYPRSTGHEGAAFSAPVAASVSAARQWIGAHARPWVRAQLLGIRVIEDARVRLDFDAADATFTCVHLARRLREAEAHALVIVAVSAGPEAEAEASRLWSTDALDMAFVLDAYASALTENLMRDAGAALCAWAEPQGLSILSRYSPGYEGWDVREQGTLVRALESGTGPRGTLTVQPSGLLHPRKSMTAVFGLTRRGDIAGRTPAALPCSACSFSPCAYRRAPFAARGAATAPRALPPKPVYAFPEKALARWAKEHLTLATDGAELRASFRFNGNNCMSGSARREFAFEYVVDLERCAEGYRVRKCICAPTPDSTDHSGMCAYKNEKTVLMHAIENERPPVLEKSLEAALTWRPDTLPAACLCQVESRNHKWSVVLQTIHFALHARERSSEVLP